MGHETSEAPAPVRSAIEKLWRTQSHGEEFVFNSRAFRLLEANCGAAYGGITGTRLPQRPADDWARGELRDALKNFFRWNGAPWYEGTIPDANAAAQRLHQAFLATEVPRTYLAPLDRVDLEDATQRPHHRLESVGFGPNEVILLKSTDLAQRVRAEALERFAHWYQFPVDKLDGIYWLIVTTCEEAGPIWKRTSRAFLHQTFDAIGRVPIFEPTYPARIEDALFVLLLTLIKEPSELSWGPFAVPWTYSVADDPFAEPCRAPDPQELTWQPVTAPDDPYDVIFEVPDRSEVIQTTRDQLKDGLEQRWRQLQAGSARDDTERANLHPLTKHFLVKALTEEGIDEILANTSCIEATFMLREYGGRKKMMARLKRVLTDGDEFKWLKHGYCLRDKYLHSLGNPEEVMSWDDLARIRWSAVKAVNGYLALTETRNDLNREELLRSLDD